MVPFQSVEVETPQAAVSKHVVYQTYHGVVAVALAPITSVANHYPEFSCAVGSVDIVAHAVADVRIV